MVKQRVIVLDQVLIEGEPSRNYRRRNRRADSIDPSSDLINSGFVIHKAINPSGKDLSDLRTYRRMARRPFHQTHVLPGNRHESVNT